MLKLKASKRDEKTKLASVRAEGLVPAVVYGPKQEPIVISIKDAEFMKAYEKAGDSTIVNLDIDGEDHDILVKEIQYDPVKGNVLHVDFYAIERGKKLTVTVAIEFEGEAPAEKTYGAMIVKVTHEVEVECLPRDLPSELKVSLESLVELDSQIHVKDILVPENVEILTDPEEVVVSVKEAREEEVDEPVEAPDMDSIEVEQKGKGEEAEGGEEKTEEAGS
jgi:large subunit ribosomal protein L25